MKLPVAVITGTSRGLGLELARQLLSRDYRVIGVARSPCPLDHECYLHMTADVTAKGYARSLEAFVHAQGAPRVDLLINNAGTGATGFDIARADAAELREQFELHCVAAFETVRALYPRLRGASIVNITSRLGSARFNARGDFRGRDFSYAYRIAKAAQNMLSLCLADDRRLAAGLVVAVIPGLLQTDSGAEDAKNTAAEGARGVLDIVFSVTENGIYHAFDDEADY